MPLTITYATFIRAPPSRVWQSLATADAWDRWFTTGAVLDPRPGGRFLLRWRAFGPDRVDAEDEGTVVRFEPCSVFAFKWRPHGREDTAVELRLEPRDDGTVVHVSDVGYTDLDVFADCAAGWGEALTLLKFHVEHGVRY